MCCNEYDAISDCYHDIDFDRWKEITLPDDERRYNMLKDLCAGKHVLEFGCGNGGFLRRIKDVAKSVAAVELDEFAIAEIRKEGIEIEKRIEQITPPSSESGKWDVIVSFMVVEHLVKPIEYLETIRKYLADDGVFICSTVNADDALLSYYSCKEFADFTYWSEHVYLYNEETLTSLMRRGGFGNVECQQVQRYSLANHLHWLASGNPGGHMKWSEFNDERLNMEYTRVLSKMKKCDTICVCARK